MPIGLEGLLAGRCPAGLLHGGASGYPQRTRGINADDDPVSGLTSQSPGTAAD